MVGGAGYSLIIAGLTLAWKRVELLQELVLMMFGSGAILPLDTFPTWVPDAAQPVFLTHAIAAVRTTLLDSHPIPVWGTGGWLWLSATALA